MPQEHLPLLNLSPADVSRRVLVVGDPARAAKAATLLDDAQQVGNNREYATFSGGYRGQRITVVSHGIGSAGAGLAFEELARGGARTLIRVGTCGAVADGIDDGSAILATGAVRDEGLTPRLIPLGYPALAHHEVIIGLAEAAAQAQTPVHSGIVLT
ncbi:MAG: purine-nucleoside phosphorylase, partial [Acidobacteriota bacterium]